LNIFTPLFATPRAALVSTGKLKDRFEPELVAAIEESRWWELDLPELRRLVETRRGLVFNPTVGLVREWIEQRGVG
jgi:hypothetical protein